MNAPQAPSKKAAREALVGWRELMELRPDDSEIRQNVASCLFTLEEDAEAEKHYSQAFSMNTSSHVIAMNYAMVTKDQGKFAESAKLVGHAHMLDPDNWYYRLGWTESLLRNGNWRDAWPMYDESRPITKINSRNLLKLPPIVPLWTGEKLTAPENQLIVIGEGGTGDRITYSRFLPMLDKLGIDWHYFPDNFPAIPGLQSLFDRVPWLQGRLKRFGDKFSASHWTTVFSLPANLNISPTQIPEYPGWFVPDPEICKRYKIEAANGKPIVGLIWGANELFEGDRKFRTLLASQAMRLILATADCVNWVNCWAGDSNGTENRLGFPVYNPKFENWEETAALLSQMDAIVSTDNGAAWLAQALGKPTAMLLSGNSDWKFLRETPKSYWHKRTRLYRNVGQGFENSIDKLITAIRSGEQFGALKG